MGGNYYPKPTTIGRRLARAKRRLSRAPANGRRGYFMGIARRQGSQCPHHPSWSEKTGYRRKSLGTLQWEANTLVLPQPRRHIMRNSLTNCLTSYAKSLRDWRQKRPKLVIGERLDVGTPAASGRRSAWNRASSFGTWRLCHEPDRCVLQTNVCWRSLSSVFVKGHTRGLSFRWYGVNVPKVVIVALMRKMITTRRTRHVGADIRDCELRRVWLLRLNARTSPAEKAACQTSPHSIWAFPKSQT